MLDAISWDIESLYDVFEVLKFWSTLVDLLGNISTLFGERLVEKCVKMPLLKRKYSIYTSTKSSMSI